MSYRALVSVQNVTAAGTLLHSQDFRLYLYEDFTNGEQIAEALGKHRTRLDASVAAMEHPELIGIGFADKERRDEWVKTYADQEWTVAYCESEGYTRVQITGKDGGENMIFFRSTVYG